MLPLQRSCSCIHSNCMRLIQPLILLTEESYLFLHLIIEELLPELLLAVCVGHKLVVCTLRVRLLLEYLLHDLWGKLEGHLHPGEYIIFSGNESRKSLSLLQRRHHASRRPDRPDCRLALLLLGSMLCSIMALLRPGFCLLCI